MRPATFTLPAPSKEQIAEATERAERTRTPWGQRLADIEQEKAALREQEIETAQWCDTWETRPLLCKLGIHRPYRRIGLPQNDYGQFQCLRCGFEWGGVWDWNRKS